MGLAIPESDDIKQLIAVERERLAIEEFIAQLLGAQPKASFVEISSNGVISKGEIKMAELREGQQLVATVALKTKSGNPAAYQTGSAVWVSSDPTIASVTVDAANELSATVAGLNGAANTPVLVTFTADGDPDDNQSRDVVATLDIVVTQGEAFVAEIAAGTPTDTP